jgi:hypothetical protein
MAREEILPARDCTVRTRRGRCAPSNVSLWQEFLHARHTLSSPHRLLGLLLSNLAALFEKDGLHVTLWRASKLGLDNPGGKTSR